MDERESRVTAVKEIIDTNYGWGDMVYCPQKVLEIEGSKFSIISEVFYPNGREAILAVEAIQLGARIASDPDSYGITTAEWPHSYWAGENE